MSALRRVNPFYLLALALLVATVALGVATTGRTDETGISRSASIYDEGPGGASVLRRYVESMGARTFALQGRFAPDAGEAAVLFVLGASDPFTPAEADALREYVSEGGTLVIATEVGLAEQLALEAFGVHVIGFARTGAYEVQGVALAAPPARTIELDRARLLDAAGATVLAGDAGRPVVAMATLGRGTVFVVGALGPFLNATIGDADNGRFALALSAPALDAALLDRPGGAVAFDEYHHGLREAADPLVVLFGSWPGRTLLLMLAATYAYLVLSGRRLGRAIPLDPRPPRSSLEYVRGMAGLLRRSGHGELVRERLRRELRTGLARELGLDPALPFDRVLAALASSDPAREREARALDAALGRRLRDEDLLRSVGRVDALLHPERARATSASPEAGG